MSTLQINPTTGDLNVVSNELVIVVGAAEVQQRIASRLRTIMGEWFLDPTIGVDYRGVIWVKGVPQSVIDATFKLAILSVPGVLQLLSYSSAYVSAQRQLTVTWSVQATSGSVVSNSEVIAA